MISNEKLLETYNYLRGVYTQSNYDNKKCEESFRSLLQTEAYKQYSGSKPEDKVSYELLTDLLLGYSLAKMINAKEDYNTVHFEYYFSYAFMRWNSGKKDMEVKLSIMSDKLFSYGIDKFVIDYRHFSDSGVRKFGTNLEVIYDVGFKLKDIEKGYLLFEREE